MKTIVTTSWDDGGKPDMRLLGLLEKYNLKGTFYIRSKFKTSLAPGIEPLTDKQVKEIARFQEIGAHTIDHPDLTKISLSQAQRQINTSKKSLEDLLAMPVRMFCYPKGGYNQEIKDLVEKAGFLGARTVEEFSISPDQDLYELKTTLHIYPFPLRKKNKYSLHWSRFLFQPLERKYKNIKKLGLPINSYFGWINLAKNLFDYTYSRGGIFHLWGHSWEIEKYGLWQDLEKIFNYLANKDDIYYLTNGEVTERQKRG